MKITVRDGLGARVTAMANAISRGGGEVEFGWSVNEHCPLSHEAVFPFGVPGVRFVEPGGDCVFTEWNGVPFFAWDGAHDRATANAAYLDIMHAMTGDARRCFQMGVFARFHRNPHADPASIAAHAIATARRLGTRDHVFLLADMHRSVIANLLRDAGLYVTFPYCEDLPEDLDRSPHQTRLFIHDWKTLCACPVIAAGNGPSCMLNPARAAGRDIFYGP